jgi:hypothetical protein
MPPLTEAARDLQQAMGEGEAAGGGRRRQATHVHGDTFVTAACPRAIVNRESSKPLQGDWRLEVCVADLPLVKMEARCETI